MGPGGKNHRILDSKGILGIISSSAVSLIEL